MLCKISMLKIAIYQSSSSSPHNVACQMSYMSMKKAEVSILYFS